MTSDTKEAAAGEGSGISCVVEALVDPLVSLTTTNTRMIATTTPIATNAMVEGEKRRGAGAVIFMFGFGARPLAPAVAWGRPLASVGGRPFDAPPGGRPLGTALAGGRLAGEPCGADPLAGAPFRA